MGLDLSIEARIISRKTEQIISLCPEDNIACDMHKGFFEICWWCGWEFLDLRKNLIEICNKYNNSNYSDSDFIISIPETALRELYVCILNHAYLSENTKLAQETRYLCESTNLLNAMKLHDLIRNLHGIKYNNALEVEENLGVSYINWKYFTDNPQDFKWEFRIFNSY